MDQKWMTSLDRKWSKNGFKFAFTHENCSTLRVSFISTLIDFSKLTDQPEESPSWVLAKRTFFTYLAYLQSYPFSDANTPDGTPSCKFQDLFIQISIPTRWAKMHAYWCFISSRRRPAGRLAGRTVNHCLTDDCKVQFSLAFGIWI